MSLRNKILSGFLILVLMLAIAGAWSIYHFQFIGNRVNKMIESEYKTVNSSIIMLHALEREDSAILLSLLGDLQESSKILISADSAFISGLERSRNSVINDEQASIISDIERNYLEYQDVWKNLNMSESSSKLMERYFNEAHVKFLNVKESVETLLVASENALYGTATSLKNLANRATMPGIIAILASLVFTLLFSYFVFLYFISPINKINKAVRNFKKTGGAINIKVNSNDEIGELADSVNYLSNKLNE